MSKQYTITGISTDVGKTVVSAIVSEALEATYWKPVQAGDLDNSDTIKVNRLTTDAVTCLEEAFKLSQPMSPHAAAEIDGVEIKISDFKLPKVKGNLVVEGAGGLLVPINNEGETVLDVFNSFDLPTILVSRHYLGSINHTSLSIEILENKGFDIAGIVYVGDENKTTESILNTKYNLKVLGRIPLVEEVTADFVKEQAELIKKNL